MSDNFRPGFDLMSNHVIGRLERMSRDELNNFTDETADSPVYVELENFANACRAELQHRALDNQLAQQRTAPQILSDIHDLLGDLS